MKAPKENQDKQIATRTSTRAAKRATGRKAKRMIKRAVKHATKRQATARKESGDQGDPVPGSHEAFLAVKCCCDVWMSGAAVSALPCLNGAACGDQATRPSNHSDTMIPAPQPPHCSVRRPAGPRGKGSVGFPPA